jgi:5-methyltetrahydrofolate--homocysteine methyltransferase
MKNFIVVGENIHCTRIFKVGGLFVKNIDGKDVIVYGKKGDKKRLPVPPRFTESADWENGKLKHTAVGIWQGMNGDTDEIRAQGKAYIQYMAEEQEANSASFLDLNVDEYSTDVQERKDIIQWAARTIQEVSSVPLSIDSSNTEILRAGLEACDASKGKPMVNSVSLERREAIKIAAEHGSVVIASATGENQMPSTKEERLANLERLVGELRDEGLEDSDIYLDPLVFPISVNPANGMLLMDTIHALRDKYGNAIHFAPGLSNVSYGMPKRKLLNQAFAYLCRERGADGGIVDPKQINGSILDNLDTKNEPFRMAKALLIGEDEFGMNFITATREGKI